MKRAISLVIILMIIFISGCVEQDGEIIPEYKDEALKMEVELTDKVLPSQAINMKVRLTNQVIDDVENVEFRVTDFYGLDLVSQTCPENKEIPNCGFGFSNCGCGLFNVQSLDEEEMSFVFRVPSKEEIARIGRELEPEFTLEYDYSGETTYFIPIINVVEKSTSAKPQLVQTKGPIHVDIKRGFTSSSGDWEINGSGFSIVVWVKDVVNPKGELIIHNETFRVSLTNLYVDLKFGTCNFDSGKPKQNITLPMDTPLVCALVGDSGISPWVYGQVKMNYDDYRYRVVKTKSIMIETVID